MANRLWSIGVPDKDELEAKVIPLMRFVNIEHVVRLYVEHDTKKDVYKLTLMLTDKSTVDYEFDEEIKATDAFEYWRKRIEYAGAGVR